jgi:hypothetical protein
VRFQEAGKRGGSGRVALMVTHKVGHAWTDFGYFGFIQVKTHTKSLGAAIEVSQFHLALALRPLCCRSGAARSGGAAGAEFWTCFG